MTDSEVLNDRIKGLIDNREWAELREILKGLPAPDIASVIASAEKHERILLFRLLPKHLAAEFFSYLEAKDKDMLLGEVTDEEARHILAGLSPDDRTEFFEEVPGQAIQRLLNLLNRDDRRETLQLLGYPEESVGRLMTPDYVAVRPEWSIRQALEHIRLKGKDSETVNVVYVTDASWVLLDALSLRKFILSKPDDLVGSIMDYTVVSISAPEDREEAVRKIQHYDFVALPVVDSEGVLLGIVTVDDVMDVAQEEATEDFHKVAAVAPLKMSYSESSIWVLYRKRIVWLLVLLGVNLIASGVIAAYEELLISTIALAFFIPLLIATGGNAGAQSATLMVRAIATGDVRLGQWFWALGREMTVAGFLGVTMGVASSVLGLFRGGPEIGLVVGLAMVLLVLVSNFIGVVLPFLITRFGLDPAVVSNPLITSVADVAGLLIYFSVATWLLGASLH
jgi:magnesium transporter